MKDKKSVKLLSGVFAATLITTSVPYAFAEFGNVGVNYLSNTNSTSENAGKTSENEENDTDVNKVTVKISANYEKISDNSYKIDFSSLDVLTGYKDYNFTISVTDAEITTSSFADGMKTGSYSVTTIGNNTVKFMSGSTETVVGGKLAFCSVVINQLPSEGKISFADFTAKDTDGNEVVFEPTLTLKEGPVVPKLSETEQAAYDLVAALPDLSELSFRKDGALIDIDELKKQIDQTVTAYNNLSVSEKAKVDEVLEYNGVSKSGLTTLPTVVNAMKNINDVFVFEEALSKVEDDDLINYAFMTAVYDEIKSGFSTTGIPAESLLMTEYTNATASIETVKTNISGKVSAADYSDKIDSVSKQLEKIKKLTTDKYYKKYLNALLSAAEDLYEDMEENCTDRYKEYMLTELSEKISSVKATVNNLGDLPTLKVGEVVQARIYTITVNRKSKAKSDAKIDIKVYKESDLENAIATESGKTFDADDTSVSVSMNALTASYPADENIVITASYTIDGATYELESVTVLCNKKVGSTYTPSISNPGSSSSSSSSSSNNSSSNSSNGTIYPDVDDTEDKSEPETPDSTELFSDISAYTWAEEAIEGLYYAGIINGMEEGVFNPAGNVTREQFCKMVVQLFGVLSYDSVSDFTDVDVNAWYAPYINSAVKSGYVQGQGGWFGVGESIMRQDMAIILYRALGSKGKAAELSFSDNDAIAEYATEAISEFVGLGILNGYEDGSFRPRGTATRAEAAKIIWGVYKILND